MPIPNRDAVALSARTWARCSLMRRIVRKMRRWSPPSVTGAGSSSGPSRSQPRWRQGLPHRLKKRCRKPGSACLSGHGPCRRRHGALSGWIKSLCCLAIPRWLCASGCARTVSRWRPMATNRKIISAPCYSWRHGCAKRSRMRCLPSCWLLAPAAVVRAFPERLCRPCRPPLLSGAGSAGAGDSGAVAGESADRRGAKTALSLTLRRAGIRRGFILPLSSLSPALIAFASKVIPYHNKPMFSEPRRD